MPKSRVGKPNGGKNYYRSNIYHNDHWLEIVDIKVNMNQKKLLFVAKYVECGNATEAAIAAGYSERSARNAGHRMMTNDDTLHSIEEFQTKFVGKLRYQLPAW